jgi:hypothetical protein
MCCAWGETGHAEVEVRAEWCTVNVAVDRAAAGIKDKAAVVVIGSGNAIIKGITETAATRVMHKPAAIAVVAEVAVVIHKGVVAKTTSVHTANDVMLGNDAIVAK